MQPGPPLPLSPEAGARKVLLPPAKGSLLPDIAAKDPRQSYAGLPQLYSPKEGNHSKWYTRRKELEAELRREFNLPEDEAAVLSQFGVRKSHPIPLGKPPPVPKPRTSKSILPPIPKPAEGAAARPRWGLVETSSEEKPSSDVHAATPWWKLEQDQLANQRQAFDSPGLSRNDHQEEALHEEDQPSSTRLDKTMQVRPQSWRNGMSGEGRVGRSGKAQLEASERIRGRAEGDVNPPPVVPPSAARNESSSESHVVEEPWRAKARELEEIASAYRHEREKQSRAAEEPWRAKARELEEIAQAHRQQQNEREKQSRDTPQAARVAEDQMWQSFAEEQARRREQLEEQKREIRQREEQRFEDIKREELRRAEKEREEAVKRRQEQEEWEQAMRQRFEEEAQQLKAARQKEQEEEDLLLQQRREEAQRQQEEREERRRRELEQQEQRRSRHRVEAQRVRSGIGSEPRSNASSPIPKPCFPPGEASPGPTVPPHMPPPPSFKRPQPRPRQSSQEPATAGASKYGGATRSQPNLVPPMRCPSGPGIGGAAAAAGNAELQAAKAAAMRDLLSLKQHPGLEARRKGFKELLRAWHPDKNPKSPEVATVVFQMLQSEQGRVLDS
eukprot:TRINITY_DN5433_c0_g1_i1.p1 TRINITY_DN5433_c0_g1~~TRINITY_DN5433_c0_g1_i1.p1  ORF type:complete len:615 (-),score=132.33 TRINITY_DN5433_c0_g1_i1:67-1911(-)